MTKDTWETTVQRLILALVVAFTVWVGGSLVLLYQRVGAIEASTESFAVRLTRTEDWILRHVEQFK